MQEDNASHHLLHVVMNGSTLKTLPLQLIDDNVVVAMVFIEELLAEGIDREGLPEVGQLETAILLRHLSQSLNRGFVLSLLISQDIREALGCGIALLEVADVGESPMIPVVEDGYRSIDIIFQVRLYQFAQPYPLAAHIAAIGYTGIEETQQTTVGIFHLTDEIALVAFGIGVEQFWRCGYIVVAK